MSCGECYKKTIERCNEVIQPGNLDKSPRQVLWDWGKICHYPITWVFGTQREARPRAILWYQMGHSLQTCRCTWWKTVSKFRRNGETSGKQVVTRPGKNTPVLAGCFILWGSFWDDRKLSRENACSARVGEPQSCHAAWNNWSWENCLCSLKWGQTSAWKPVPGASSLSGVNGLVHLLVMGFRASTKPCLLWCRQVIVWLFFQHRPPWLLCTLSVSARCSQAAQRTVSRSTCSWMLTSSRAQWKGRFRLQQQQ